TGRSRCVNPLATLEEMPMHRRPLFALIFAGGLIATVGCDEKKKEETAPPAAAPAAGAPAPAPAAGAPAAPAAGAPAAGPPAAARAPAAGGPAAAPGDKGSVKGTVALTGKAPAMEELKRNSDPFCAKTKMKDEQVVAGTKGELANVIVHINGAPAAEPPKDA